MYAGVPTTAPAAVSPAGVDGRRGRIAVVTAARAQILGQAPVDDDRLAEGADQDVARLEVAVDDALVVRVRDRLGDGDDVRQQRQPIGARVGVA